jgi:hypothetical protein
MIEDEMKRFFDSILGDVKEERRANLQLITANRTILIITMTTIQDPIIEMILITIVINIKKQVRVEEAHIVVKLPALM